nr:MAG TPA: hypothetical protein [Caudoviricetes sp.]
MLTLKDLEGKLNAIVFLDNNIKKKKFVPVDKWEPSSYDEVLVNCVPGSFIAPLVPIGLAANIVIDNGRDFNRFILPVKKGYNSSTIRSHLFRYINYFCNFYDQDREYLMILFNLKSRIDRYDSHQYPVESFFNDLDRYIIHGNLYNKVYQMTEDNYCKDLNYKNIKNPTLQYNNDDAKLLHRISLLIVLSIPLLTQYAYMHKINNIDEYLLKYYDRILYIDPTNNIYEKMFETAYSSSISSERGNPILWGYQGIRGQDVITHSQDSIVNIIINIIPKYTFDNKIISFNYASIKESIKYKVTDIQYEFQFISSSSSKRDNDSVSDFDRFESALIKQNEALYLQNKINSDSVMKFIENKYGPFHKNEVDFYIKRLMYDENGNPTINKFQKQLVFLMFYKYFKDTQSIYNINQVEYIELILAAKKILQTNNMPLMSYIISAKVDKLVQRKNINKKERLLVEASPFYPLIMNKYKSDTVVDNIFSIIATILSSDFTVVDPYTDADGQKLDISSTVGNLIEEVCSYILIC